MFQMLTCFDLKAGVTLKDFETALAWFAEDLTSRGLAEGSGPVFRRCSATPLDTDAERDQAFFFLMTFRDKAQSDAAFAYIDGRTEPGRTRHLSVFNKVASPIFICWER